MTELTIPAGFGWMTTRDVLCEFSSEKLSKVYVSTEADTEPFAGMGYALLFEDLWPSCGDYVFNDFVANYKVQPYLNYRNKVREMLIAVRVKVICGSLLYDRYLQIVSV